MIGRPGRRPARASGDLAGRPIRARADGRRGRSATRVVADVPVAGRLSRPGSRRAIRTDRPGIPHDARGGVHPDAVAIELTHKALPRFHIADFGESAAWPDAMGDVASARGDGAACRRCPGGDVGRLTAREEGIMKKWMWWVLASAIVAGGCGSPAGLVPVSGKVLYRGEPAAGAVVYFHRQAEPGSASGGRSLTASSRTMARFARRPTAWATGPVPGRTPSWSSGATRRATASRR